MYIIMNSAIHDMYSVVSFRLIAFRLISFCLIALPVGSTSEPQPKSN